MSAVSTVFWKGVDRVLGASAGYGLRLVAGHSPLKLVKRSARVWQVARAMLHGDLRSGRPVRLQVETTDICNLKCRMCAREALEDMDTTTMTLEAFTTLVDAVDPFYVTLNGLGEPLIDKTIFEKLDLLHGRGIYSSMPTNSSFLEGTRLQKLLHSFPSVLTLSLDGATKQSFEYIRRLAKFDQTISRARELLARRAHGEGRPGEIRILCALQKANLFDFKEMFALMKSLGAPKFNLVRVFDYEPEGSLYTELIPSDDDVHKLIADAETHLAGAHDPAEVSFVQNWKETAKGWLTDHEFKPEENTHSCGVPWFSSYVDAKGRVYPCCYLLTAEHVMGNIHEQPFEKIWNGDTYRRFRAALMSDRPHLNGCNTCPRNDDALLGTLGKYRLALPPRRSSQDPREHSATPAKTLVRLPVLP